MSNLREPAAPAVIAGSFADYRLIKSRSVLQLVIEIPVEAQAVAFDVLGFPMPGIEIPVAVARLNEIPADAALSSSRSLSDVAPDRGINRGASDALTPKARYGAPTPGERARSRAGRLPREDERFRFWAAIEKAGFDAPGMCALSEDDAAQFIRDRCCGGASRKLIAEEPEAMDKFIALETAFKIAVGEIAEPR